MPYLTARQFRSAVEALVERNYLQKTISSNSTDRTAVYRPTASGCQLTNITPPDELPACNAEETIPAPKKSRPVYDHDSNAYRGAVFIDDAVHKNFPQLPPTSEKQLQAWSDSIRLLHERDAYSYTLIYRVASWSLSDRFWRTNIRSATSLRKHFQQLLMRMPNDYDPDNAEYGGQ